MIKVDHLPWRNKYVWDHNPYFVKFAVVIYVCEMVIAKPCWVLYTTGSGATPSWDIIVLLEVVYFSVIWKMDTIITFWAHREGSYSQMIQKQSDTAEGIRKIKSLWTELNRDEQRERRAKLLELIETTWNMHAPMN